MECSACKRTFDALKRCSRCTFTLYCSKECQVAHWGEHKEMCKLAAPLFNEEASPVKGRTRAVATSDFDHPMTLWEFPGATRDGFGPLDPNVVQSNTSELCPMMVRTPNATLVLHMFPDTPMVLDRDFYPAAAALNRIPTIRRWLDEFLFLKPSDRATCIARGCDPMHAYYFACYAVKNEAPDMPAPFILVADIMAKERVPFGTSNVDDVIRGMAVMECVSMRSDMQADPHMYLLSALCLHNRSKHYQTRTTLAHIDPYLCSTCTKYSMSKYAY